jgi:hypothetical protein
MSGYLANLVSRSLQQATQPSATHPTPMLRPELPSIFAPAISEILPREPWEMETEFLNEQIAPASSSSKASRIQEAGSGVLYETESLGEQIAPTSSRSRASRIQEADSGFFQETESFSDEIAPASSRHHALQSQEPGVFSELHQPGSDVDQSIAPRMMVEAPAVAVRQSPPGESVASPGLPSTGVSESRSLSSEPARSAALSHSIFQDYAPINEDRQLRAFADGNERPVSPQEESSTSSITAATQAERQPRVSENQSSQGLTSSGLKHLLHSRVRSPAAFAHEADQEKYDGPRPSLASDLAALDHIKDRTESRLAVQEDMGDRSEMSAVVQESPRPLISRTPAPTGPDLVRALHAASRVARAEPHPTEQIIEVSIGRIEVRAPSRSAAKPSSVETAKGPSLSEYLRARSGRRRP